MPSEYKSVEMIVLLTHCTEKLDDITEFQFKGFWRGNKISNVVSQALPEVIKDAQYMIHASINAIVGTTLFVSVHKCKPLN